MNKYYEVIFHYKDGKTTSSGKQEIRINDIETDPVGWLQEYTDMKTARAIEKPVKAEVFINGNKLGEIGD